MLRHFTVALVLILFLAVSSGLHAAVVGDWEGGSLDGWEGNTSWDPAGNPTLTPGSTIGVTLNQGSLKVEEAVGWKWTLIYGPDPATFLANSIFSMDVTRLASDWTLGAGDAWNNIGLRVQGDNVGLTDLGDSSVWWNPSYSPSTPMTISWDYTAVRNMFGPNPSWVQLVFYWNNGGDWTNTTAIMYLDNAQLTPEPGSLALLAAGGLALRRRRQSA